jgi:uncharacterized protein (TIGR04255 family)
MPSGAGAIVIQHGLATTIGSTEIGYTVDLDFSLDQKTGTSDVRPVLEHLHGSVGRAFRWFITEELHRSLDPTPFQDDEDAHPSDHVVSADG